MVRTPDYRVALVARLDEAVLAEEAISHGVDDNLVAFGGLLLKPVGSSVATHVVSDPLALSERGPYLWPVLAGFASRYEDVTVEQSPIHHYRRDSSGDIIAGYYVLEARDPTTFVLTRYQTLAGWIETFEGGAFELVTDVDEMKVALAALELQRPVDPVELAALHAAIDVAIAEVGL